jgi:hypothetical protein
MVELISDRMLYTTLRGHWCDIIVLNVHAPTEVKSDNTKDSFREELEHVFDYFPKYHMKMLGCRRFQCRSGERRYFQTNSREWELHDTSNESHIKNLIVKILCSHITAFINTLGLLLMGKHAIQSFTGADCDTHHYLLVAKVWCGIVSGSSIMWESKNSMRLKFHIHLQLIRKASAAESLGYYELKQHSLMKSAENY